MGASRQRGLYGSSFACLHRLWAKARGSCTIYQLIQEKPTILPTVTCNKLAELLLAWEEYVRQTGAAWGAEVEGRLASAQGPEDSVGGDPVCETRAGMSIGEGEVSAARSKHL